MKRIIFFIALVALSFNAAPRAQAGTEISIDFFYDNLNEGSWIEAGDYGYCWQPNVAVSDRSWRPYADGYWAYTDVGWTWVSYEDFGWATYHYGRWARLHHVGWVWVPGTRWGPAWVSWRTGGDYVGWAPLPPRYGGGEPIYEGRPVDARVDVEFDIGPEYYNFVDVRYIGEPVLRRRIFAPTENITYINNTVNVTNITYNNSVVYNYGPDYNRINAYSTREIPRLQLQRESDVDLRTAAQNKAVTKVQGNQLVVAAPMTLERPAQSVAPRVVKTKLEQPKLETGWSDLNDPRKKAELQTKMKTEDAKLIPPPKIQPVRPEELKKAAALQGSPATGVLPATGSAADQGKLTREQMKQQADAQAAARKAQVQQENDAKKATQAQQTEQMKQQAEAKKVEREQQMKQTQEAAAARKAQMQQDNEAKKALQSQQAEQLKQQTEAKKAERDQQLKQRQEAAAARKAQMQQNTEARKAAQSPQAEQVKQQTEAKKAERDQQMQGAAAARKAQVQQENESRRAAQMEQMKQAQETANARKAQMQQENDPRRAAQTQQLQQQVEARRAAREQQPQKVQQPKPQGNPEQAQQGGERKGKKGQPPPEQTPPPEQ